MQKNKSTVLGRNLPTTPVNIGPRSTPNYGSLMQAAVQQLPGGIKAFAGQSDDPFFVDLGSVFDLAGLRPFNPAHVIPLDADDGVDGVGGFNTHSIVLQVPIKQLTRDGKLHAADDPKAVVGVYATASRQRIQIIDANGRRRSQGSWVQVSRLANPLINEVVIPLGKKDRWNASDPSGDASFASRYLSPEVTKLANALYPVLDDAPETGRGDIQAILLTGVPGLNFTGQTKADLHSPEHRHRADRSGRTGEPASASSRATSPASRTGAVSRTTSRTSSSVRSPADTAPRSRPSSRVSASAPATPTGRPTTSWATAWTRTTARSTSGSRTSRSPIRATSTFTTRWWAARRRGIGRGARCAAAGPSIPPGAFT